MIRILLAILALLSAACLPATTDVTTSARSVPPADAPPPPSEALLARVTFVSDGDSFKAEVDGTEERIRMVGINTPEQDECFGTEARDLLIELIDGRQIQLVSDVEAFDQYGRMLAYVYVDDVLINAEMARLGAALARAYEPNTTLQRFLDQAEADAQAAGRGMWSTETCGGDADPTVVFVEVNADAPGRDDENPNGEFVVLQNQTDETIDLGGWTVRDESSVHRYEFPTPTSLPGGATVTLYSGCGNDEPGKLFWCGGSPVWDNSGDTAFLLGPDGSTRHRFAY